MKNQEVSVAIVMLVLGIIVLSLMFTLHVKEIQRDIQCTRMVCDTVLQVAKEVAK